MIEDEDIYVKLRYTGESGTHYIVELVAEDGEQIGIGMIRKATGSSIAKYFDPRLHSLRPK